MTGDPFRDDLEAWQSGDGDRHPLVHHDTTTAPRPCQASVGVPSATANATIERDFDGNPFPGVGAKVPHVCANCAEWEPFGSEFGYSECRVFSGLTHEGYALNEHVQTPADFPGCGRWREKAAK